uniref:UPF0246 protein n=1 Tax=Rhabditophanes sp. KR3021 TaxID=114890 RepID=A0AC35TVP4_9BILA
MDIYVKQLEKYLHDHSEDENYDYLKELISASGITIDQQTELNWRLLHMIDLIVNQLPSSDYKRKKLTLEGADYVDSFIAISPDHFQTVKWSAALTGLSVEYVDFAKKPFRGVKFKQLLDKALSMEPDDLNLLHMRGRYNYEVTQVPWIQKKAARLIFGAPIEVRPIVFT